MLSNTVIVVGFTSTVSCEQEARLVDHVTLMAKVAYGYTHPELCNLATEYAVELGLREKDQQLSLQ